MRSRPRCTPRRSSCENFTRKMAFRSSPVNTPKLRAQSNAGASARHAPQSGFEASAARADTNGNPQMAQRGPFHGARPSKHSRHTCPRESLVNSAPQSEQPVGKTTARIESSKLRRMERESCADFESEVMANLSACHEGWLKARLCPAFPGTPGNAAPRERLRGASVVLLHRIQRRGRICQPSSGPAPR